MYLCVNANKINVTFDRIGCWCNMPFGNQVVSRLSPMFLLLSSCHIHHPNHPKIVILKAELLSSLLHEIWRLSCQWYGSISTPFLNLRWEVTFCLYFVYIWPKSFDTNVQAYSSEICCPFRCILGKHNATVNHSRIQQSKYSMCSFRATPF